ncbi:MAG: helix-turn-helix domain-containing protein [Dehalococcoidia bacterium]|nr:helix-turn-helix domain-containing protein [Dehalococcoidia bacterium]
MNQKEQARISVLNSVLEYQVPIADAAELLGVTQRQARRMLAAYRERGAAALAHGNRGRRPSARGGPLHQAGAPSWCDWRRSVTKAPTTPTAPSCSVSEQAST